MPFKINIDNPVALRDAPLPDASFPAGTIDGTDLLEKITDAGDLWWEVKVVTPGLREQRKGFVRSNLLTEVEHTEAEKVDERALFRQIADAAVRLCVNQDYLFAVAFAAGGLTNTAGPGSSAVGPFRFLPETWNELVKFNGEENDITADDITDPGSQAVFAAILAVDAQTQLNNSLSRAPTIAQLYFSHLFGIEAAASILGGDQQNQIEKALREFYSSKPGGAELADKIVKSNLTLVNGKTVGQALDAVVDPLAAGLKRAAVLAKELGLEPQAPASPASVNDLRKALRDAVRRHEIGNDSTLPYKLSFAEKGRSGASFGFMQGDLGQNQPEAKAAFRRALTAASVPEEKISSLMQSLSSPVARNPLNDADTKLVNDALNSSEGRVLVNDMDEQILADVYKQLDKCIDVASASRKTITPKAQAYILLWINMSGKPTTLCDWLSGNNVTMAESVPAPGPTVDGTAIENYLGATEYFFKNDRNFRRIKGCVAEGNLSDDTADVSSLISTPSAGAERLTAREGVNLEETEPIRDLVAIIGEASKTLPDGYCIEVISAMRRGATVGGGGGRSRHADGIAIDIQIINPRGEVIPNRGEDDTGLYERLAIAAYHANQRMFPARTKDLAWGGNFGVAANSVIRDLMHFDYGGDRGRLGPPPRGDLGPLAQLAAATTTTV
jgi:hypothetical protein